MTDRRDIYVPPGWTYEERRRFLDDWHAQEMERERVAREKGEPSWLADDSPLVGGLHPDRDQD